MSQVVWVEHSGANDALRTHRISDKPVTVCATFPHQTSVVNSGLQLQNTNNYNLIPMDDNAAQASSNSRWHATKSFQCLDI